MRLRACNALLLLLVACVTTEQGPREPVVRSPRRANLQRAAALPWTDEGRCVVREAAQTWPVVVERCFPALDTRRVRFRDIGRRCSVASADAASVQTLVGICLLSQPELVVGAVIIIGGSVVVAVAIRAALDAYELSGHDPEEDEARTPPETKPAPLKPLAKETPKLGESPLGRDWPPPNPPDSPGRERRPECEPIPVPHRGGNNTHNTCADRVPNNLFPGWDVLINGKHFDALTTTRMLWEVKTTAIETYNPFIRDRELEKQVTEGLREKDLAEACGYGFVIGVRTETHKKMLLEVEPRFTVELMPWCRDVDD